MTRVAECSCGQLRATVEGEPARVSVRHCLACQRRTGSTFAAPGFVAIPVGAFADPGFPPPAREIYGDRRHPWVSVSSGS